MRGVKGRGDRRPDLAVEAAFKRLAGGHKRVIEPAPQPSALRRLAREAALTKQNGRCRYCRAVLTLATVTAEHKRPRCKGGTDAPANIAASCSPCNGLKARRTDGEFMRLIKAPPPGSPLELWLAHAGRRLNLAAERACRRIMESTT